MLFSLWINISWMVDTTLSVVTCTAHTVVVCTVFIYTTTGTYLIISTLATAICASDYGYA